MELNLDAQSPQARRANELARELLTSRTLVGHGSDLALFTDSLQRVIEEILEGFVPPEEALVERTGYLIAALSYVGAVAVWSAAKGFEAVRLGDAERTSTESIPEEDIRQVLGMISEYMASHPSGM